MKLRGLPWGLMIILLAVDEAPVGYLWGSMIILLAVDEAPEATSVAL